MMVFRKAVLTGITLFCMFSMSGQCVMCKALAEQSADDGKGLSINQGIFYLMAFPYLIMAAIATIWVWSYYKKKKVQNA